MARNPVVEGPIVRQAVVRLNAATSGLGIGVLMGVGLFVATMWLVIKGGPEPGQHLGLLNQFLPGYSVSVGGAFLGSFYAFVFGYCGAFLVAKIYNKLARSSAT